jgi:hypothetical protein
MTRSRNTLSRLIAQHRQHSARHHALRAASGFDSDQRLAGIERHLEQLEKGIVEYPVTTFAELESKLGYLFLLTGRDQSIPALIGRAAADLRSRATAGQIVR